LNERTVSTFFQAAVLAATILVTLTASGRLRSTVREFPTRPRLIAAWTLLFVVVASAIGIPAVNGPPAPSLSDLSLSSLFTGHYVLIAFLAAWWGLRRPVRLSRFLHLEGARWTDVGEGLALGVRVWGFTLGAAMLIGLLAQLVPLGGTGSAEIQVPQVPDVMIWMVRLPLAAKAVIILVAMTVEEAFFRAFLQTRIGLIPSSVLFAIAHASYGLPTLMVGVFVVSIILGRDFAKHGQLLRCIFGHGVFDAVQLLVVVPFAVEQLQLLQSSG